MPDGAADLVADLYRRMPAARSGELLAPRLVSDRQDDDVVGQSAPAGVVSRRSTPLGWEHINLTGGNTAGRAPTPSGTAKRLA